MIITFCIFICPQMTSDRNLYLCGNFYLFHNYTDVCNVSTLFRKFSFIRFRTHIRFRSSTFNWVLIYFICEIWCSNASTQTDIHTQLINDLDFIKFIYWNKLTFSLSLSIFLFCSVEHARVCHKWLNWKYWHWHRANKSMSVQVRSLNESYFTPIPYSMLSAQLHLTEPYISFYLYSFFPPFNHRWKKNIIFYLLNGTTKQRKKMLNLHFFSF